MLRIIGRDNFKEIIKKWPDFQLVSWARNLEKLTENYDLAFYSDFYQMLMIVQREIVNRLEKRIDENDK